jgi:hypothetical protein
LPAGSVSLAVSDHVPSERDGRSHDVAVPTTYEHDSVDEPLVAVMVIVSPAEPPVDETFGVVSVVRLSVDDEPVSDTADRSVVPGAEGAVVSTVRGSAVPAGEVLPAGSVSVPDTDHEPSVRDGKSHEVAEPTTYVHDFVVEPLDAVTVAVSPDEPPGTEKVGVVSEVMLSVLDEPVSDEAAMSGADGAEEAVVSTVRGVDGPAEDVLPATSVRVPDTVHDPSVRDGRSHEVAEPTTYVHDFVVEPFEAVIVAVSPEVPPGSEKVGVESDVMLSVLDEPVSDEEAMSGADGAAGGAVSMVTVLPSASAPGPTVPPDDVTEEAASLGMTVPWAHPDAVTVNVVDVPVVGLTEKVQPAVPALLKSAAEIVDASTPAVNVSEYDRVVLFVGDADEVVKEDTPNAV